LVGIRIALLALLGSLVVVSASPPDEAAACDVEGPCFSPVEHVLCPFAPAGSSGEGTATFNIPKSARNPRYEIIDQTTGAHYGPATPFCSGTTMTVQEQFTPGANEDQYTVVYKATSDGSSNPSEAHDLVVKADWDIESDLGITKEVVGDGPFYPEHEIVFKLTVRNYGPGPAKGLIVSDVFPNGEGFLDAQFQVTKVLQIEGPTASIVPDPRGFVAATGSQVPVGGKLVFQIYGYPRRSGLVKNNGAVVHLSGSKRVEPGPDPHPNAIDTIFSPVNVQSVPDSSIKRADSEGVSGKSSEPEQVMRAGAGGVSRVEVAILKRGEGTQPFEGLLPERQPETKGACTWLKNLHGKFTSRPANEAGVCDSLVFLKATGTKKWRLELQNELGPGHYVAYSRAVGADGGSEGLFDAADGNVKKFVVKR
jgi:uncharacterized repeat protein (TIGR01451 family)